MGRRTLGRRRFIRIAAAVPGMALIPTLQARVPDVAANDPAEHLHVWRGVALGADAMIQLHHPDAVAAKRLISASLAEVARLERVFSLYDEHSSLCLLNRFGTLNDPPLELVDLLGQCEQYSRMTAGAFDATVQPLWDLYAAHFSDPRADPMGPARTAITATLQRVGHGAVIVEADRIHYARAGMAMTLNGIAQGYITDRVVDLLRRNGVDRTLVDMGEIRAIGGRPLGGPWIVGLEDPAASGQVARQIALENRAVSTSGGYGTLLDPAGRFNHIFDPATGGTSWRYRRVSVVAETTTAADALSTAFSLMPIEAVRPIVRQLSLQAYFVMPDGRRDMLDGDG
jgi:thiamine biosynthesis lipoprotein